MLIKNKMDKVQSFAITVRPLDGITETQIQKFLKWTKKQCDYYHVITEKTMAERHIHAGLFMKVPKTRSNVSTDLMRLFKDLSDVEKSVLRKGLKIMYNEDFILNYLNKGDDTVVVASSLPEEGHMESYFPPKPEVLESRAKKCSAYYHELEKLWYEHRTPAYEVTTITTRDFLFEVMYDKRVLPVIRDDKQIIQVSRHLTRWLNKVTTSSIELPVFEKEE
jgi:hypothetical protein